ncbi:MAG: ester cyclase, partial [Gemmatimonadetes bacterium]|nr:ester cyclase [Gemmatimonadota bacterium]
MPHPPAVGRDTVRRFSVSILRAFPDCQYEIRAPVCIAEDGTACLLPWTITATHTGPFDPPGLAPTNRRVRFSGLDYFTLRDRLVARIETRFDPAEPIEQLIGCRLRPRRTRGGSVVSSGFNECVPQCCAGSRPLSNRACTPTGGVEVIVDGLVRLSTPQTVTGIVAFVSGLVSAYSSTVGVVLPTFLPTVPGLAERLGADPMAIASAINVRGHLVDV